MGGSESKPSGAHPGPMRKWDWGDYSTAYAENILREHAANSGEFIVRKSKKLKSYCISVLVNRNEVRHFPIEESYDGWFSIGAEIKADASPSRVSKQLATKKFSSIPELVHFLTSPGRQAKRVFQHFGCFLVKPMPKIDTASMPQIVRASRKPSRKPSSESLTTDRTLTSTVPGSPVSPNFTRARFNSTAFAGSRPVARTASTGAPQLPASRPGIRSGAASFSAGSGRRRAESLSSGSGVSLLPGQAMGELDQAAFDAERRERAKIRQRQSVEKLATVNDVEDDGDDGDSTSAGSTVGSPVESDASCDVAMRRRSHSFTDAAMLESRRRLSGYANLAPDGSPIGGGPVPTSDEHVYEYQNWQTLKTEQEKKDAAQRTSEADLPGHTAPIFLGQDENPYLNEGFNDDQGGLYQAGGSTHYGFSGGPEGEDDDGDDGDDGVVVVMVEPETLSQTNHALDPTLEEGRADDAYGTLSHGTALGEGDNDGVV
eukprot:m.37190 g.37190  ORF g.37190 m.37190 type:complete len:487 (+) comp7661_c0_seq1:270-1730(+)